MYSNLTVKTLVLWYCASAMISAQQLGSLDVVQPGELLPVVITPYNKVQAVSFSLETIAGEKISENIGFGYNTLNASLLQPDSYYDQRQIVWVSLLAVTADIPADKDYYIVANLRTSRGQLILRKLIHVAPYEFKKYTLHLNKKMSTLIGRADPVSKQEALERWDLIKEAEETVLFFSGTLKVPVEGGRVTSRFGQKRTYVYLGNRVSNSWHRGHDIAAPQGTPVYSSSSGEVVMARSRRVTGKTVIVALMPGVFLQYQHLSEITVTEGERIEQGRVIGKVGTTGFSTGPHLHQELYVRGVVVDPSRYYNKPLLDKNLILSIIQK